MPYMKHPKLGDVVIEVADTAIPIHMASGWRPLEGKEAEDEDTKRQVHDPSLSEADEPVLNELPETVPDEESTDSGDKVARRTKKGE